MLPRIRLIQPRQSLIGEKLGGPMPPATVIAPPLVALAVRRHQVGPLLFGAVRDSRHQIAAGPA